MQKLLDEFVHDTSLTFLLVMKGMKTWFILCMVVCFWGKLIPVIEKWLLSLYLLVNQVTLNEAIMEADEENKDDNSEISFEPKPALPRTRNRPKREAEV